MITAKKAYAAQFDKVSTPRNTKYYLVTEFGAKEFPGKGEAKYYAENYINCPCEILTENQARKAGYIE